MTKAGLIAARHFGLTLPVFRDLAEAEQGLYPHRDELLRELDELSRHSATFRADFSPESLKSLEHWYFELRDGLGFRSIETDEETFECAMAMYLGEVLVRNIQGFDWFVTEFAFERGRYQIGVRRPLLAVMLSRQHVAPRERNKRQQSIWRMYNRYSGIAGRC